MGSWANDARRIHGRKDKHLFVTMHKHILEPDYRVWYNDFRGYWNVAEEDKQRECKIIPGHAYTG